MSSVVYEYENTKYIVGGDEAIDISHPSLSKSTAKKGEVGM